MGLPLYLTKGRSFTEFLLVSSVMEVLTYPLDTLKTVYQADVNRKYGNVFNAMQNVLQIGHIYY